MTVLDFIIAFLASAASVGFALLCLRHWASQRVAKEDHAPQPDQEAIAVLLSGSDVVDVTPDAADAFGFEPDVTGWDDVRHSLAPRFENIPGDLATLDEGVQDFYALDPSDAAALRIEKTGAQTRLVLNTESVRDARLDQLLSERAVLKHAVQTSPHPCWQTDRNGRITWQNAAYIRLAEAAGRSASDPVPVLSDGGPMETEERRRRVSVRRAEDGQTMWFDLAQQRAGAGLMNHAVDIAPVIQAEIAQHNFVQTLAKTFAQLSIGLAIFDRNGQLALFNPALVDLTHLPAEFLSAKPDMLSFFDRLREERMMPEPKSYTSWRQEIAAVIAAAADGRYQETWSLESGQTYRVSGRPHPDKAVAFLIEDISAEIMITRNFRTELEMGQSLMDSLDDAIVAFSPSGVVTFSNEAYRAVFGVDPEGSFADVTVIDALKDWQGVLRPSPELADIRDFVQNPDNREAWMCHVHGRDGQHWVCYVQPIALGATAVRFAIAAALVEAAQ